MLDDFEAATRGRGCREHLDLRGFDGTRLHPTSPDPLPNFAPSGPSPSPATRRPSRD
jgi:hypothetical protein